ncbi:MAG: hypothetical protein ACLR06_12115 [Christensenellaceae bacterium]
MSATNTRLAKRRTRDMIFFACLVALPLLHFFIFYICVNFNSILLAFKSYDSESGYQWVGLQNFKNLFSDFKTLTLYKYALKIRCWSFCRDDGFNGFGAFLFLLHL